MELCWKNEVRFLCRYGLRHRRCSHGVGQGARGRAPQKSARAGARRVGARAGGSRPSGLARCSAATQSPGGRARARRGAPRASRGARARAGPVGPRVFALPGVGQTLPSETHGSARRRAAARRAVLHRARQGPRVAPAQASCENARARARIASRAPSRVAGRRLVGRGPGWWRVGPACRWCARGGKRPALASARQDGPARDDGARTDRSVGAPVSREHRCRAPAPRFSCVCVCVCVCWEEGEGL